MDPPVPKPKIILFAAQLWIPRDHAPREFIYPRKIHELCPNWIVHDVMGDLAKRIWPALFLPQHMIVWLILQLKARP